MNNQRCSGLVLDLHIFWAHQCQQASGAYRKRMVQRDIWCKAALSTPYTTTWWIMTFHCKTYSWPNYACGSKTCQSSYFLTISRNICHLKSYIYVFRKLMFVLMLYTTFIVFIKHHHNSLSTNCNVDNHVCKFFSRPFGTVSQNKMK